MAGTGKAHLREGDAVLRVEDLVVDFPIGRKGTVSAVAGISFDVMRGETLGIVGESGCGKSTTGRAIMQIETPTSGSVVFEGRDLTALPFEELRSARTKIQMIFQDPISSLNPRRKVRDSVKEPLDIWARGTEAERGALVDAVLETVGIDPDRAAESRPHQFSGGQRQRIGIARALALNPKLIIGDEPVSALDVSVQAQVINLLGDLSRDLGLTLTIPAVMLFEAFVSFLGMGVEPPKVSWGLLAVDTTEAINPIKTFWWLIAWPAAAMGTTLLALNILGDGLRDALDPKLRGK